MDFYNTHSLNQQFTDISLLSDTLYWLTFNSSQIYHSSQTHYTGSHSTVHGYITPLRHIILAHIQQFTDISLLSDTLSWLTFNSSQIYHSSQTHYTGSHSTVHRYITPLRHIILAHIQQFTDISLLSDTLYWLTFNSSQIYHSSQTHYTGSHSTVHRYITPLRHIILAHIQQFTDISLLSDTLYWLTFNSSDISLLSDTLYWLTFNSSQIYHSSQTHYTGSHSTVHRYITPLGHIILAHIQQFTDISLLSDTLYWLTFNSSQIYQSSDTLYWLTFNSSQIYHSSQTHYTGSHSTVHGYITPLRHIILAHIQQFTDISLLSDTLSWLTFNSSQIYHSSQTHYTGSHSTVHRYITPLRHIILAHIQQFTDISLLSDTLYWLTFNSSRIYHSSQTHYTGSHSTVHRYITPLKHIILAHIQQFTDISLLSDTLYWLTFNSSQIYHSSQTHYTGSHSTSLFFILNAVCLVEK